MSVSVQYEHFHTILYNPFLLASLSVSVSGSETTLLGVTAYFTVLQINNMNKIFNEMLLFSKLITN